MKSEYLIWIVVIVVGAYFLWSRRKGSAGVSNISASALQERLAKDPRSVAVVDVREPFEFNGGHIVGAKNVPLGQVGNRLREIPQDKDVVFVCRSGHRSMMAAKKAQQGGLSGVINLAGGMSGWRGPVKK